MSRVWRNVPHVVRGIIGRLIDREGGYVDDPDDPGGATNMGITFDTLQTWRQAPITKEDVKNLERNEAEQIYFQFYWEPLNLHYIMNNWWFKEFIFDWSVHSYQKNTIRQVQRYLGVNVCRQNHHQLFIITKSLR